MYPYLSLVERKEAEFYYNIDRRSWLVWVKMTYFHRFFGTIPGVLSSPELWGVCFCFWGRRWWVLVALNQWTWFKLPSNRLTQHYIETVGGAQNENIRQRKGEEMGSLLDEGINKPPRWNIWLYTLCHENCGHTMVTPAVLLLPDLHFWWAQPSRSESWVFSDEFRNWPMLCLRTGWHWEGNKKVPG